MEYRVTIAADSTPASFRSPFYERPTLTVLRELIGKVLVHEVRGRRVAGVIVEAEAYISESDPACHAAPGLTKRNAPLYGPPGRAYVYFNYGMHYLVNAVTEAEGAPAAVLIRALAPLEGLDVMRRRRARVRGRPGRVLADVELCRGPGNACAALGVNLRQNQWDLRQARCGSKTTASGRRDWSGRRGSGFVSGPGGSGGVRGPGTKCVSGPGARVSGRGTRWALITGTCTVTGLPCRSTTSVAVDPIFVSAIRRLNCSASVTGAPFRTVRMSRLRRPAR